MVGRIHKILIQRDGCQAGVLVVERFDVGEALHFKLGMPILSPPTQSSSSFYILPSNVSRKPNVISCHY